MNLKKLAQGILLALPVTAMSLAAQAADKITLKLAHNLDNSHVVSQALEAMAKEVEKESGGSIRMRIYPGGQMGGPRETIELMQNGALDMTKGSASEIEPFAKPFALFSLPYLFTSQEQFNKVIYGDIGREMMQIPKDKGFVALAAYQAGSRSFYAKKPIHSPADLKGLKIRVVATPTTLKMIELLGGAPTPIPFGEVYTALQQGVIDAAENNEPSYYQTRHAEVAKYYAEDGHTMVPDYLLISTQTWNKLDDKQKQILTTAAQHSETYEAKLWDEVVADSRKKAEADGSQFIQVDKKAFRDALAPLYEDFRKDPEIAPWLQKVEGVEASK
ncbi:hypothetical protein WH50_22695 [Pokkaliibacter plantistimulans]|uniref:C4-dicarboxylate ABC transporter substrate-binding protein n=2 Tax=Pseudomonadota TaxID=1224 RepID=A0ABX5LQZ9_9GAMM|nr:TRAP transporter substrate-binding protein [Pokkaliibacter plantistimulans]PPC78108.1 hypothetical protein C4K68_06775 [Pokkaliibacter plantistimulans]PXF29089.1 hypothetical protein WH50_22695 [Pokkaliibacter plantistimulans]